MQVYYKHVCPLIVYYFNFDILRGEKKMTIVPAKVTVLRIVWCITLVP